MSARGRSRKADAKGRVLLFPDFANTPVVVERVGEDEVRIRKVRFAKRFSLDELLAGITDDNLHGEIDPGPPVGNEAI